MARACAWGRSVCGDVMRLRRALVTLVTLAVSVLTNYPTYAQRSSEDAVAQAEDAFGMTVGRESIGLYSTTSARGFSPIQAGNLRIDGLYFDEVTNQAALPLRIFRSAAVHVGIAAQGYLFPAPTGVVDYQLRAPGDAAVVSTLNGYATYGEYYDETDFAVPVSDVLRFGGGIGYTHNSTYDIAASGDEWTAGWIARWRPTRSLVITPFWGMTHHIEYGEKPYVFIDESGVPRYRAVSLGPQRWADYSFVGQDFGTTARMSFGDGWLLAAGVFRSLAYMPITYSPLLAGVGGSNTGDYSIAAFPQNSSGSTSGEVRLAKLFATGPLRSTVYLRLTGRDSSVESGGEGVVNVGPATTTYSPYDRPVFPVSGTTDVQSHQWTPGVAYRGVWQDLAELTLGVQRVYYNRTVIQPELPTIYYSTSPWLMSAAASGSITHNLLAYTSYTRGFENIGSAPVNAVNANEPVPSQLTWQVDGGIRYQILPRLQFVAGVFEINKPYFNLDQFDVFRLLGATSNRGAEFSLTGDLTNTVNVVSGFVWIEPQVRYTPGALPGPTNVVAIGPIPGYMSTYLQYHPQAVPGLILGSTIQVTSSRYGVYPNVSLPANIYVGADIHYKTKMGGHDATWWLEMYNLSDVYSLTPSASGQLNSLDARRFELSLVVDI
jgi:iron complex outermembrane recepter protein